MSSVNQKLIYAVHDLANQLNGATFAVWDLLRQNPEVKEDLRGKTLESSLTRSIELLRDIQEILNDINVTDFSEEDFGDFGAWLQETSTKFSTEWSKRYSIKVTRNSTIPIGKQLFRESFTLGPRAEENLIENAKKAGATEVHFKFTDQGSYFIFSCQDNGNGMDQDTINKLMLKLYKSEKNHGIGTQFLIDFVHKIGGIAEYHSELGEGTTFLAKVPYN